MIDYASVMKNSIVQFCRPVIKYGFPLQNRQKIVKVFHNLIITLQCTFFLQFYKHIVYCCGECHIFFFYINDYVSFQFGTAQDGLVNKIKRKAQRVDVEAANGPSEMARASNRWAIAKAR